jgi:GT2 family glycosyltransferase
MMLWPEKDKISSLGNTTHFLGFGYCLSYKEKIINHKSKIINTLIHYPSGSSMFFRRQVLEEIGLLDEEYWMYNEDQEIGWRIWLAGYKCVLAPKAVLYNKYEFLRSIKKFYWMDRNRIISILICYRLATLLLILPAFVVMEIGLILFSFKTGWFRQKLKVWAYFLRPHTWRYLARARRRNQGLRQVKDKQIALLITGRIWYQEIGDWKLRLINPVFELYWQVVKAIMWW